MIRKIRNLLRSPHLFFTKHLTVHNEIGFVIDEEDVVAKHLIDLNASLENKTLGEEMRASKENPFFALKGKYNAAVENKDFSTALRIAKVLVKDWPEKPEGWNGLVQVGTSTLPLSELIPELSRLYKAAPKSTSIMNAYFSALLSQGDVKKAQEITLVSQMDNPNGLTTLRLQARLAVRKAKFEEAENLNLRISKLAPDNPQPLFNIINLRVGQNDLNGASEILESLKRDGRALPGHHYLAEQLREQRAGHWISVKRSTQLVSEYPGDDTVAIHHSRNLQFLESSSSKLKFLEEYINRYRPHGKSVWMNYAWALVAEKKLDAAIEVFTSMDQRAPHDHSAILGIAKCHYIREDFNKALAVLSETDTAPSIGVYLLRSQIFLQAGDPKAAFSAALSAFRLCPDPSTYAALSRSLQNMGRDILARRIVSSLEDNFSTLVIAWVHLADFESDFGSMDRAIDWYERLLLHPDSFDIAKYSDTLWQLGLGERAWCAALAETTRLFRFLSLDYNQRNATFIELSQEIFRCHEGINKSHGFQRNNWAKKMANIYVRPHAMKVNGRIDKGVDQKLRTFSNFERRGLADKALSTVYDFLPEILDSISEEPKYFNFVRRVAKVAEDCGQTEKALILYEQAARVSTSRHFGHQMVQRTMRNYESHIKVKGSPPVAILIVTWKGNFDKAEELGRLAHASTGRTAVTLTADLALDRVRIVKKSYGYNMTVPCADGYEALPEKVTRALRHLFACSNCEGVLKIDDDIVVTDFEKFEAMVQSFQNEGCDYIGIVENHVNPIYHMGRSGLHRSAVKIASHRNCLFCDGGSGYYLSRKSLREVFRNSLTQLPPDTPGIIYEDVYLGELMASAGIIPKNFPLPETGGFMTDCFGPITLLNTIDSLGTDQSLSQIFKQD